MMTLRKNPHIYEINLMVWLEELSRNAKRNISLKNVGIEEWSHLKDQGIDIVWLMGIWQRSPYSVKRARNEKELVNACSSILDDFNMEDVTGSPYAVYDYTPDPRLCSNDELLTLKKTLEDIGLLLILDFVPNHTACDHPWIERKPRLYIHSEAMGGQECPDGFFLSDRNPHNLCFAHGRDPYFPPWTDTAQINYFHPETSGEMIAELVRIADYCHGFRCDMAMLVLKDVFRETWGSYQGEHLIDEEFWTRAMDQLKSGRRECLLLAEAYWGKEQDLLNMGFDYAYDKELYDLLVKGDVHHLRTHLSMPAEKHQKMLRFLENHDEPRAMDVFGHGRIRCAMVIHSTLPGLRFWQHGQFEGNRIKLPVQLRRTPKEATDYDLKKFSEKLLKEVNHPVFHDGYWEICPTFGWEDNSSHEHLLTWVWEMGEERRLVVTNFSTSPAQGYVKLPPDWTNQGENLFLIDPLKEGKYMRPTEEILKDDGLYVGLESGDFHFFRVEKG